MIDDEILRGVAQSALKQATESLAKAALDMAPHCRDMAGDDALKIFAAAIVSNNLKHFGGSA